MHHGAWGIICHATRISHQHCIWRTPGISVSPQRRNAPPCARAGALGFLLAYTLTQVRSVSLTLLIVATILLSFPLALALYTVALGFRWIGVLHFLGLFIILGIGADDIFVRALPPSACSVTGCACMGPARALASKMRHAGCLALRLVTPWLPACKLCFKTAHSMCARQCMARNCR